MLLVSLLSVKSRNRVLLTAAEIFGLCLFLRTALLVGMLSGSIPGGVSHW